MSLRQPGRWTRPVAVARAMAAAWAATSGGVDIADPCQMDVGISAQERVELKE